MASIQYERILRERKLQQAREADERMKARAKCALCFILPEVDING
nr:MAG TPA: Nuclear transcription factor Y subunit histone fold transcription factor.0A [Caudoviricetes sp.]